MKIFGVVIIVGIAIGACAAPSHKEPPVTNTSNESTEDERLTARLREAARGPVDPATIEAKIGRKALINTSKGFPLEGLRRVNLNPDPDHPAETLSLERARTVMYWARPVPGEDPHIIGVQWHEDGSAAVFFGIVQPP